MGFPPANLRWKRGSSLGPIPAELRLKPRTSVLDSMQHRALRWSSCGVLCSKGGGVCGLGGGCRVEL